MMYGEYVDEDLPLPPFREVFAFAFQSVNSYNSSSKKRPLPKNNRYTPTLGSSGFANLNPNEKAVLERGFGPDKNGYHTAKLKRNKEPSVEESTG